MYNLRRDEKELLQYQLDKEVAILEALDRHYRMALETIEDTIAKLLGRGDANLPHVIHQVKYQQAIKAQVDAALDLLQSQEFEDISQYLFQSYEDGFVGAMYSMYNQDIPLIIPIDTVQMIEAVQLDSQISEGLNKRLGVDTNKLKRTIRSEVSRGIASGMLFGEIARNIQNAAGITQRRAQTIVRTEAGRIQEKARDDAAAEAQAQGANVVGQWCSVLDGKTRESHRMVDGQLRELGERFSNGLLYPKESGGAAKEVINCRCTRLIRAKWALDEDELVRLQKRAAAHGLQVKDSKTYGHVKAMDFADFKKSYLKAAETIENTGNSGIIKVDLQFFAEKDLWKQKTSSLKKGLESFEERIAEHQRKIADPKKYVAGWDAKDERERKGLLKHWQKEISNFQESVQNRIDELRKRGEYDE